MNSLVYIFYKYRQTLAMVAALLLLNFALVKGVLLFVAKGLEIPPPPFAQFTEKGGNKKVSKLYTDYANAILNSSLFPTQQTTTTGDTQTADNLPSVEFDKLGLVLLGTITGPEWFSRAYIKSPQSKDKAEQAGKAYKIKEYVQGARVIYIGRTEVHLLYQKKKEKLYLYPQKQKKIASNVGPVSSGPSVKKVMTRGELQKKVFGNLNNIMKGIAVMPNFVGGKMDGYRLKRIHPSNILYSMGARSGDLVMAVNGHRIDDIKKVLALWEGIQKERNIRVDINRNGSMITYDFEIRD